VRNLVATLVEHGALARARLAEESAAEHDAVEAQLRRHHAMGHAAWPDLALSDVMFAEALAPHVEGAGPVVAADLHATDFFLAAACTMGVEGAVGELSRAFLSQIPRYIAHVCRPSDREQPEDIAQAIAERVAVGDGERPPRISAYSGRGPLGGWLRVLSVRMALNTKRGVQPALTEGDPTVVHAGFDPELDHFKWRYRDAFKSAFEAAFAALDDEQRLLLRLHTSGSHRGEDIARVLGVERSTVTRRLARAREVLFDATKLRMTAELNLSPSEFDSIARALPSNIELTLSRVLAPRAPGAGDADGMP
jgi:RNA polymerase sigma-70 factor, ECF subfamily